MEASAYRANFARAFAFAFVFSFVVSLPLVIVFWEFAKWLFRILFYSQ